MSVFHMQLEYSANICKKWIEFKGFSETIKTVITAAHPLFAAAFFGYSDQLSLVSSSGRCGAKCPCWLKVLCLDYNIETQGEQRQVSGLC